MPHGEKKLRVYGLGRRKEDSIHIFSIEFRTSLILNSFITIDKKKLLLHYNNLFYSNISDLS